MPTQILDALPSIHTTVIGFGGAFFSAFSLYAYQKLRETRDRLDKVLDDAKAFSTPRVFIGGKDDLLLESGEFDWDGKARHLFDEARSLFKFVEYEGKFIQPPDEKVKANCRSLCRSLYYVLVSYPFNEPSVMKGHGLIEKLESKNREAFDENRLREIYRRIEFLGFYWKTSRNALIELANQCTKIEHNERMLLERPHYEEFVKRMEQFPDAESQRLLKERTAAYNSLVTTDFAPIIVEYFNKIIEYEVIVLPPITEALRVHDLYSKEFEVKKLTLFMIGLTVFILILGVFTPPTMQSLKVDYGVCWHPSIEYLLLVFTSAPYFLVCGWLFNKVRKSNFR